MTIPFTIYKLNAISNIPLFEYVFSEDARLYVEVRGYAIY